jgi:hypothetical protein
LDIDEVVHVAYKKYSSIKSMIYSKLDELSRAVRRLTPENAAPLETPSLPQS